jgi:hypothetical protein
VCAGALGEDVEDQAGAVHHPAAELLFQVAFLAGTEGVVEHHHLRLMQAHLVVDLLQLAATDKGAGMGGVPLAHYVGSRVSSRRQDELLEFAGVLPLGFAGKIQVNEHSALSRIGSFKKQGYLGGMRGTSGEGPMGKRRGIS